MPRFNFKRKQKTKEPENVEKAYDYAVFLLSLHLRTIGEVLKKMQDRGYTEQVINQVIELLKQQRYLDDQRYAEIFLENLKTYRNFGYYGIKKKMMEKKLPMSLIETTLQEGLSKEEELKIAQRLLKKEGYNIKSSLDEEEGLRYQRYSEEKFTLSNARQGGHPAKGRMLDRARMSNRLKSRGFRGDIIAKLLF